MTKPRKLYKKSDKDRWVREGDEKYRSPFRRDYARLLHSPVCRRLQGKTQLFPGFESDFFRNRLTHSLEVAQVAKSIANRLNQTVSQLEQTPIDLDIVEFAGLAHDLGHPPFGHNGERALDACMKRFGGFEGNAQTLRILSRLEKKKVDGDPKEDGGFGVSLEGEDYRAGLNLTARSLAAVLKYDKVIPVRRDPKSKLAKGYYKCEEELVNWVRSKVLPPERQNEKLKTIECQIMDLADDIAYSTYDLEDAFKAGFLTPLELLALDKPTRAKVADEVRSHVDGPLEADDVSEILVEVFEEILGPAQVDKSLSEESQHLALAVFAHQRSAEIAKNGYARNLFTSRLVSEAVEAIYVDYDEDCPTLSQVKIEPKIKRRVETLKRIAYLAIILSPRLKVAEYRGYEIVQTIFQALADAKGDLLLPEDFKELFQRFKGDSVMKHRLICDFIAGMTDAYAIEFYARLKSENARTIFKPF